MCFIACRCGPLKGADKEILRYCLGCKQCAVSINYYKAGPTMRTARNNCGACVVITDMTDVLAGTQSCQPLALVRIQPPRGHPWTLLVTVAGIMCQQRVKKETLMLAFVLLFSVAISFIPTSSHSSAIFIERLLQAKQKRSINNLVVTRTHYFGAAWHTPTELADCFIKTL